MQLKQKAWRFDGNHWNEIEFALSAQLADWDEGLRQAGFRIPPSIQIQRAAYCVNVHESVREAGRFLVLLTTQGSIFPIIADGLPAMLGVVNQAIPIVRMGGESVEKYQRADLE